MNDTDIKNKNLVVIDFLKSIVDDYKIKAEYSTNDNDDKVIVVQEEGGQKICFYGANPIYNYYNVNIFSDNIKHAKETSVDIGNLIGNNYYLNWKDKDKTQKWQILIKQFNNPRTIEYMDIRRVAYTCTLKCIVNRIS